MLRVSPEAYPRGGRIWSYEKKGFVNAAPDANVFKLLFSLIVIEQYKLECFFNVESNTNILLALLTNIRGAWQNLQETNAQAYFAAASVTKKIYKIGIKKTLYKCNKNLLSSSLRLCLNNWVFIYFLDKHFQPSLTFTSEANIYSGAQQVLKSVRL
jgi:hypothetical protein